MGRRKMSVLRVYCMLFLAGVVSARSITDIEEKIENGSITDIEEKIENVERLQQNEEAKEILTVKKGISEEAESEIIDLLHGESPCTDVHCKEEEHCQLRQLCEEDSCRIYPQCIFINASCPTPLCDDGCYVVEFDNNSCPTCECNNSSLTERDAIGVCLLPNCTGSNCHLIANKEGCPICSCDPPCPVCPPSCQVQVDIPEGRCPECVCNEIVEKNNAELISCPEPVCYGTDCIMKTAEDNCTRCVCTQCLPPECDQGCKLVTSSSGGCPKCECPTHENMEKISCPVPVCHGVDCVMKVGEDNCTHCVCLACSPPKCEPGCKLESDALGGCPKCECPENEIANKYTTTVEIAESTVDANKTETTETSVQCPELKCQGYNCRIFVGTDGCQFCTCESKCPPTKCIPGCFVDKNPLQDECPGCICRIATTVKDVISNES